MTLQDGALKGRIWIFVNEGAKGSYCFAVIIDNYDCDVGFHFEGVNVSHTVINNGGGTDDDVDENDYRED